MGYLEARNDLFLVLKEHIMEQSILYAHRIVVAFRMQMIHTGMAEYSLRKGLCPWWKNPRRGNNPLVLGFNYVASLKCSYLGIVL